MAQQPDNLYRLGQSNWTEHEARRLLSMDGYLHEATVEDLDPILQAVAATAIGANFLDIGCGTASTTEDMCAFYGLAYWGLDRRWDFLAKRKTDPSHTIVGDAVDTKLPSGINAVTFSRAVGGWIKEPELQVAEQCRLTQPGGYAHFMEFDWTGAGAVPGSGAWAALNQAKTMMVRVLRSNGYDPFYGAKLGAVIDAVAAARGLSIERREHRHDLHSDDHRNKFMETAENIALQLEAAAAEWAESRANRGEAGVVDEDAERAVEERITQAAVTASMLRGCMETVAEAKSCEMRIPAIVSQTVRLVP